MKCPECDGVGRIHYGEEWCCACNGTGEVMTNEEWFCQLSTEEKAAFLANYFMFDCPMADKDFQKREAHNFTGLEKLAKETILEWLKQPHKE